MTGTARSISVGVPGSVRGDDAYTFTQKINGNQGIRAAQPGTGRYNVMAWITGDGTTDDYANLVLAQTAAVAASAPLYFPVGCQVRLGTSWTTAVRQVLIFEKGAQLLPDAGVVVQVNGDVIAGQYQIFGGAGTFTIQQEVIPEWWGAIGDNANDDSTAINAAITAVDTTGGRGNTVRLRDGGIYYIATTTLTLRANVQVEGAGRRATIINYVGAGVVVDLTDASLTGISKCRISQGTTATTTALRIRALTASCQFLRCHDLDITAPSNVAGQIGVSAVTTGTNVISASVFDAIRITNLARPLYLNGPEGNSWTDLTIETFGTGVGPIAIEATTNDDMMDARVAGVGGGVSAQIAYQQAGHVNHVRLTADSLGTALNVTGTKNKILLSRPLQATAIGTFGASNTVLDDDHSSFRRICGGGTTLVAGDFNLGAGFGSTATVTSITGTDQRCRFIVNSAGVGQAANPIITIFFHDGAWPAAPFATVGRVGGSQPGTLNTWAASTIGLSITFVGTPVAGESYAYEILLMG